MTETLSPAGTAHAAVPAGRRAAVVATVESRAEATGTALRQLPAGVTGIEVRADLTGDIDPDGLRQHVSGQVVYTLRSSRYGGRCTAGAAQRWARLRAAAHGYDLVDLEADHDLVPEVLDAVPPRQRRISWYGEPADLPGLRERFTSMAGVPAALYLLAPAATSVSEALDPLRLLASLRRDDVTAFGTGPAGGFSRVLAPWLGAPVVYGGSAGPTASDLVTDYPFPDLPQLAGLCGIVGRRLGTSLFLRLVNAGLRELSRPALMVPFIVPDRAEFIERFWPVVAGGALDELGFPLNALTVAVPYKPAAFAAAGRADQPAETARAANLMLRDHPPQPGGRWRAATTDGSAMLAALSEAGPVADLPVAVVGCGDAGRAAAHALAAAGAQVTLVNRGAAGGRAAAARLGLPFVPLSSFDPHRYRALVHATPLDDRLLFPIDGLASDTVVADFVCAADTTALIAAARRRGLTTVDGRTVLAHEVRQQFRLMTGEPLPESVLPRDR